MRVATTNGRVEVVEAGGATHVRTSFAATEVSRIQGDLSVESQNGPVRAMDVQGSASVRTSFGAVTLEGVAGTIDVDDQNGSVDVRAASARRPKECDRVTIRTSFGSIRLAIPADAGYALTARTSFGRIHSELPVTSTGSLGADSLAGTIGNGRCPLTLTNSNGNIDIVKGGGR